jgi:hypothetical protein
MVKALWQIQQAPLRQAFDPVVHACLMGMFAPFVEGTVVMLSDGRQAVVTSVDPANACYPTVAVVGDTGEDTTGERTIRLVERESLRIALVDGVEVEKYLCGVPMTAPRAAA